MGVSKKAWSAVDQRVLCRTCFDSVRSGLSHSNLETDDHHAVEDISVCKRKIAAQGKLNLTVTNQ